MKDKKPLVLTREGRAPPLHGPERPSERAGKATCGGPTTSRLPSSKTPSRARSKVSSFPSLSGPGSSSRRRGGGEMGWEGGGEVIRPRDGGLLRCPLPPANSGELRSCLLITTTKNHTGVPPCSSWAALLWGSQRASARLGGETVGGEAEERGKRRLRDKKGGGKGAERVERKSWTETKAQRERSGEGREK